MAKLKKFSLMMTEDMHSFIQKNAESRGLTMNAVVITALESHFFQASAIDTMQQMIRVSDEQKALEANKET